MALEPGEAVICLGCGQPMAARAGLAVCSHRCRKRELRARHRRARRLICTGCRREFVPTRKDARYCTDGCRFKAYRARNEARAAAARASAIAKAVEARRAAEVAKRRYDFVCSLIG
jgi:hypothetical protein